MSNETPKKGLRDELGDGYVSLLDSVRHSIEQIAWGQQGSGNLADDFYRWVGPGETAPGVEAPETGGSVHGIEAEPIEGRPSNLEEREAEAAAYARHLEAGPIGTIEMDNAHDHEWRDFEAWIDGRDKAMGERETAADRERNAPEIEIGD